MLCGYVGYRYVQCSADMLDISMFSVLDTSGKGESLERSKHFFSCASKGTKFC